MKNHVNQQYMVIKDCASLKMRSLNVLKKAPFLIFSEFYVNYQTKKGAAIFMTTPFLRFDSS
jgi:hypothetical protein